jgi:hypothetical protein
MEELQYKKKKMLYVKCEKGVIHHIHFKHLAKASKGQTKFKKIPSYVLHNFALATIKQTKSGNPKSRIHWLSDGEHKPRRENKGGKDASWQVGLSWLFPSLKKASSFSELTLTQRKNVFPQL